MNHGFDVEDCGNDNSDNSDPCDDDGIDVEDSGNGSGNVEDSGNDNSSSSSDDDTYTEVDVDTSFEENTTDSYNDSLEVEDVTLVGGDVEH